MGKLDEKKKQKRDSLLMAAFALFTDKGINDTSISDIARKANMAKGTFYLYFKDKFDIRDKLIANKAGQIFRRALEEINGVSLSSLEDHVIFLVNSIVNQLNQDKSLLKFISKNLSWGVFQKALLQENDADGDSFYHRYYFLLNQSGRKFRNPDLMLYMIVELVNSTCHNVILQQEPVTLEELKPELCGVICDIIKRQEIC
ncbi:MAG: TetR/AcrR family transcriptional regulator [Eubacterium sp.]|nr:TetR/AcrR family transcriptional regulator [Eubacterium sp.]